MKKILVLALGLALLLTASLALAQTEVKIDAAERKKLNTFFSNFSEADVPSFTEESLTDPILIDFAIRHNYINNFKALKKSADGMSVVVPVQAVDRAIEKYFGVAISKHAKAQYTAPLADGEAYIFSQISSLASLGNDLYMAKGIIYSTGSGETPDPHASPDLWKKAGQEVDQVGSFTAVVRKVKTDKERYVLVEYVIPQ